ncbi:hypothetical protein OS493_037334, partial [Desmophyllum pertusum]
EIPVLKQRNKYKTHFRSTSCLDYLLRGDSTCGIYRLYDNAGNSYPAYCDLKSEPGYCLDPCDVLG